MVRHVTKRITKLSYCNISPLEDARIFKIKMCDTLYSPREKKNPSRLILLSIRGGGYL